MLPNSVSYCRAKPFKVLAAAPRPREKGRFRRFRVAISDRPPSPPWDLRLPEIGTRARTSQYASGGGRERKWGLDRAAEDTTIGECDSEVPGRAAGDPERQRAAARCRPSGGGCGAYTTFKHTSAIVKSRQCIGLIRNGRAKRCSRCSNLRAGSVV